MRRTRLTDVFNAQTLPALVLISAPAGYGKSTLAKSLVEELDYPFAWLSLDVNDNDLGEFLRYFVTAVQRIFPDALPETRASLMAAPLPNVPAIAKNLINELLQIDQSFIFVLDDYHIIDSQPVHDLLNDVLLHPPHNFHLVVCTRMDPLLPLINLRASGQMIEIRSQDLRFNLEETRHLFEIMIGDTINRDEVIDLDAQVEGWVTGLRLAALAKRHRIGRDSFEGQISPKNRYVTEYLVSEILAKQAAALSDCMLKTSILDRFSAELCEAICFEKEKPAYNQSTSSDLSGFQFTEWLRHSNLFVIPLDDSNTWFRYHHLFRDFLRQELSSRFSEEDISILHAAAGRWFASNGWIEEALHHLLKAEDSNGAIQLVAEHRYKMMNRTQWPRLEKWLKLFQPEIIANSSELWMLKTWLVYHRGQYSELPALLQHLAYILENEKPRPGGTGLAGEISSLRSLIAYYEGDAGETIYQAQQALDLLPVELWIVRILARIYLGGGYLMAGDENSGYHAFYDGFEEEAVQNEYFKATLLMTAANFHWLTADMKSMAQAAEQCIALSKQTGQQQILEFGKYQLGRVRYQQDDLPEAEQLFASVVSKPYLNYGVSYTNSACGLALTYQAQGKEVEAQQVSDDAIAFLLGTGNTTQLPLALALQAELALVQGRISFASQWAEKLDPVPPLTPVPWIMSPHLTLVKVWLTQNTPTSLKRASELLNRLESYMSDIHNTRFLIETQALQAIYKQVKGDQSVALDYLEQALLLAQPGLLIRLFVDLGPQMERLINQLEADTTLCTYVEQIQASFRKFPGSARSRRQKKQIDPLTNRELEILALLAERKTNKEIAQQLGIAPGTVRQHTHNLYQKLEVNNRRAAVTRALERGLLSQ